MIWSLFQTLLFLLNWDPDQPTDIRWVKIFTWRANGDGINPFANTLIEDCFLRTQGESFFIMAHWLMKSKVFSMKGVNASVILHANLKKSCDKGWLDQREGSGHSTRGVLEWLQRVNISPHTNWHVISKFFSPWIVWLQDLCAGKYHTPESNELIIEDCTVVYARAKAFRWRSGRIFNMRTEGGGAGGNNVIFR